MKKVPLLLALLLLLTACAQPPEAEMPSTAPQPTESLPEPIQEDVPLTLAGRELCSAILFHEDGNFDVGEAAKLDELFSTCGFAEEEPFYLYTNEEGEPQLTLWYDAERKTCVGLCGEYGFAEKAVSQAKRRDEYEENMGYGFYRWEADPVPVAPDGMEDYQEEREYDEVGRLIKLNSTGVCDGLSDQRQWVYSIDYTYDENGVLRHRTFGRNSMIFGSTNPGQDEYYDEQGRLIYEWGYITHGHTETYYIYEGDNRTPSHYLYLDFCAPYASPIFAYY